jgi:redox-sensing transcriptional repressor
VTKPPGPSPATVERLELMAAILADLVGQHRDSVTSNELARWLGTTSATVRKDISLCRSPLDAADAPRLGGSAYQPAELLHRLQGSLLPGPAVPLRTAVAGLGDWGLGVAAELARLPDGRFHLVAGFDSRANTLEQLEVEFPLWPTTEITAVSLRLGLELAVLSVPANESQKIAERFVLGGVRKIINYSATVLRLNRRQVWVRECGLYR